MSNNKLNATWSEIDQVDFESLYNNDGNCKICGGHSQRHNTSACVGNVVDKLVWEYYDGYDRTSARTLPEAIKNRHIDDFFGPQRHRFKPSLKIVCDMAEDDVREDDIFDHIHKVVREAVLAKRDSEHKAAMAAWEKELDALNAIASDYSTEGFQKRFNLIMAKKPKKKP
jgi:hypothetical protein